ncbi:MAG: glycosyltransferase family 1 protein [Armatimonadetes bacterium]|nr:glycosyltransferase family 1 protein [Armatimonadota bacterium]
MRITVVAPGSRGDVQPFVALGRGLREAGHALRVVTHQDFEPLVSGQGLEFRLLAGNMGAILRGQSGRDLMGKGRGVVGLVGQMMRVMKPMARQLVSDAWEGCQGADLLLTGGSAIFGGLPVASRLGIPLIQAHVQPVPATPTRAFPCALMPPPPLRLGGGLNRLTHVLAEQAFVRAFRPAVESALRDLVGPIPGTAGDRRRRPGPRCPVLYGFSTHVVPRPDDWDDSVHVTGYWFLERDPDWRPADELVAFLASGRPPVYVGFGSMGALESRDTATLAFEALRLAGQRGVILRGWGSEEALDAPDHVLPIDSVPHDWLFPQMAAVVHHGGAGTTAAGLRAGIPSVVVPVFADQPFWGRRLVDLGVGPQPIPHRRLTAQGLAGAITAAVSDEPMRRRAKELGQTIRAEDGVARAVRLVPSLVVQP